MEFLHWVVTIYQLTECLEHTIVKLSEWTGFMVGIHQRVVVFLLVVTTGTLLIYKLFDHLTQIVLILSYSSLVF